jgi:thiosulfate dehydrogenase
VISLKERINDCFERSLSGKPAPEDSPEMDALLAYLDWISFPVKNIKETPWRGLPDIKISHKPDPKRGAEVYERFCSSCHMQNGQGNQSYPPLWGSESFNSGAGMNRVETLAGFTYYNMPYQTPMLTKQESLDVAAYITSQDRPKLK